MKLNHIRHPASAGFTADHLPKRTGSKESNELETSSPRKELEVGQYFWDEYFHVVIFDKGISYLFSKILQSLKKSIHVRKRFFDVCGFFF